MNNFCLWCFCVVDIINDVEFVIVLFAMPDAVISVFCHVELADNDFALGSNVRLLDRCGQHL